jgi:hypothetical protein
LLARERIGGFAASAAGRGLEAHGNDVADGDKAQGPELQPSQGRSIPSMFIRHSLKGDGGSSITSTSQRPAPPGSFPARDTRGLGRIRRGIHLRAPRFGGRV